MKTRKTAGLEFIRTEELLEKVGISRSTLWRWQRAGVFPQCRELGPNSRGWLRSEVEEWMASRPQARTNV